MRKPRCAEPVTLFVDGYCNGYAACNKPTPCSEHPKGKIDTIPNAVATVAKWKRDARRDEARKR